jgi:hypothetical protein
MSKKKIDNVDELLAELGVTSLAELKASPEAQAQLTKFASSLSPDLLRHILGVVPELAQALQATIRAMEGIGTSLEESKRARWEILKELAKTGKLSGDQILEAMRIIQEIEKNETIDWSVVLTTALKYVGGAVALTLTAVGFVLVTIAGGRKT